MRQILYHLTHAAHLLLAAKKELDEAVHFAKHRRLPKRFLAALTADIRKVIELRTEVCDTITITQLEIEEQEA